MYTSGCTVQGGDVELLYWPATTTTTNTIHAEQHANKTWTTTPQAVTAIYKNLTLSSPSIYIEFKTAFALDNCGQSVGGRYPGAIISLDPEELYTIQADFDFFVVTTTVREQLETRTFYQSAPMNYHDLTGLPPGAAFQAMPICVAEPCDIITPSRYHPQLVLPTQVRALDAAWTTCGLDWQGLWDPPKVLQPAEVIDPITTPVASQQSQTMLQSSDAAGTAAVPFVSTAIETTEGHLIPTSNVLLGLPTGATQSNEIQSTAVARPGTTPVPAQPAAPIQSISSIDGNTSSEPIGAPGALQSADVPEAATVPIISHDASPASLSQPAEQMSATIVSASNAVSTAVPKATSSADLTATESADTIPLPLPEQSPEATYETGVPTSASNIGQTTAQASPTNALDVLTQAQYFALLLTPGFTDPASQANSDGLLYVPVGSGSRSIGTFNPPPEAATSLDPGAIISMDVTVNTGTSAGTEDPNIMSGNTALQMPSSLAALLDPLGSLTLTAAPILPTNDGTEVGLSLGTQTLAVDGHPVTISGYTISAPPNGISVDGTVIQYSDLSAAPVASISAIAATLALILSGSSVPTGSRAFDGAIQLDSQTLSPGGTAAILAEHTLSAASDGAVLDGTTTATFQTTGHTISTSTEAILLSLDPSNTMTAIREPKSDSGTAPGWIIGGQTLVPGGSALVISSHTFSVASGEILEDGTKVSYSTAIQVSGQAEATDSLAGMKSGFLPAVETAKAVFTTGASTSYPATSTSSHIASTTAAGAAAFRSKPSLEVWWMSIFCVFLVAIV
ncbi:hypothetical protein LTR56_014057 [Elasticomyces elasticus]|nr:hypothetical protein LTR56_014057 [Elasticomyces elasticus]KAK4922398.1 hypothetical protein LTR49_010263 [Elasticomyces elasticus]KAK5765279.1 hypothetical protein LTS12_004536 [Elasticomyces elasticus]